MRRHHRPTKRRAIQTALDHLGWHVRGKDVVALLASYGIEVSESLVSKVKVERLKKSETFKRYEEKLKLTDKRRRRPTMQKRPAQRSYRR